jgi:indole-3-glycerol phosphate synthase
MNALVPILEAKHAEVARRRSQALPARSDPPRGFARALLEARDAGRFGLIAEIKKASPSKGLIRADFRPAEHAMAYAAAGAACLSVLTDEPFFQGSDAYLRAARAACALPVLRKDFVVDAWQVREAAALGADAVLLIVAALEAAQLREFEAEALELGLDVLVEVHDERELDVALDLQTPLIGVNNRDLTTMRVDVATSARIAALVPDGRLVVAESGLENHDDLQALAARGVSTFLVGESLMREADVEAATRRLLHG